MCPHRPQCPSAEAHDRDAAHTVAAHPEQGWSLLCNGVIVFDDMGEILPDGRAVAPRRPTQVRPTQVRPTQVRPTQVRPTQVRLAVAG